MLSMLVMVWKRALLASAKRRWSIDCMLFFAPASISPAISTIGVLPRYAAISEVPHCVSPGPQVTIATPTLPVVRAYPSAIDTAMASWRALYGLTEGLRQSAPHSHMLPSPISPKKSVRPSAMRDCAIAS